MAVQVLINGVDRTKRIDWQSLKIQNIITNRVDKCSFLINTYEGTTYKPTLGNEVVVYRDATKIFGGVIVEMEDAPEAFGLIGYSVECVDYSRLLDGKLVTEVYENMTVNSIIADLISNWSPAGFTINNVDCSQLVEYVQFNYETISDCLKKLANLFNYDWYVDYDKDVHFFAKLDNAAPFALNDNDGSYIYDSLQIQRDNSQIRNVVIVRGGEYLANTITTDIQTNGVDFMFNLPYRYDDISATLSTTNLKLGIDFSSDPDSYDALWNRDDKIIKFKEADKPSASKLLRVIGQPYLPVLVKVKDNVSINSMISAEGGGNDGQYEYLIVDRTLNSREAARTRALGELYGYATTISEGTFETEQDGLRSGQSITIISASRGIAETFMINKVSIRMKTPTTFYYQVSLITTKTYGMIDLLRDLLNKKTSDFKTTQKEILDLVEAALETVNVTESTAISASHNPVTESLTLNSTFTAQSLNYDVEFTLGPQAPSGTKRNFILNGSRFGPNPT